MKFFSNGRPCLSIKKPKLLRKKNEEGSFLIEVLVAGTILLMLAASAVTHLTSLTNIKIQTETRDRALALATSLHETMQSAGCGFNVSPTKEIVGANISPWDRVGSCAFSAVSKSILNANPNVDEDGILVFSDPSLELVKDFCQINGVAGKCELGDQDFIRNIVLNDSGTSVDFKIKVRYWFEKTGLTNPSSACTAMFLTDPGMPDVIVRKLTITWPNTNSANGVDESITVVKRQNIPADSIEFSSSSRVGIYVQSTDIPEITFYTPITNSTNNTFDNFQITRKNSGMNCLWFPYINKELGIVKFSIGSKTISADSLHSEGM